MRALFTLVLAALFPTMPIYAQNAPIREQVRHDWNKDGFIDKAELVQDDETQSASLNVYMGKRGGFNAPIIATRFAESTPISGDPAHLSLNAAKSIVVTSSHIGIGRSKYEANTIVAFRQGQMRVIGYQISRWDSLDPDAATSCDVNFNTGRALALFPRSENRREVRHRLSPVPIRNWKLLPALIGVCPAYE